MSLKSLLHSSFRHCCRVTSLCSRSASWNVLWGEMICMARRWMVSTTWLCSLVSAVDQTWQAYSVFERTKEKWHVSKSLAERPALFSSLSRRSRRLAFDTRLAMWSYHDRLDMIWHLSNFVQDTRSMMSPLMVMRGMSKSSLPK